MTGMGKSLDATNPVIVAAFESTLFRQGLVVLVFLLVLLIAWQVIRLRATADGQQSDDAAPAEREPAARRLLRIGFGCIWLFDGILQAQVSMPLGLPSSVIQPAAAGSPDWVRSLVSAGLTIWNNHPIAAAASAVWIQVGLGFLLLAAPRSRWSRVAGVASALWGLVVWVFGEAFGSIFAPGLTWLFGAPGAALFYVLVGVLVALPARSWHSPRLGRGLVAGMGVFFLAMALLQAWPGRGFWQGQPSSHAAAGTLTSMIQSMAATPQPSPLARLVSSFATFDAAHGWAVNLFVVIALTSIGAAFLTGRRRIVFPAVVAGSILCLADWIFIEDLGFLGGVGTDPNSMIPMALVFVGGYIAMTRLPKSAVVPEALPPTAWRTRLRANPTYALRGFAALGAVGIVLLGAAPMAIAATNPIADPILTEAVNGSPVASDFAAAPFSLEDQNGQMITLAGLAGRVLALTFLDPVCTTDCPVIAQELHQADELLGSNARDAVFVAIAANPVYHSIAATRAFDRDEGLAKVSNWLYLTGPLSQLERAWNAYGVQVAVEPAGAMVAHSEVTYIIDGRGRIRYTLDADPGQATATLRSSFSELVASKMRSVLAIGHGS